MSSLGSPNPFFIAGKKAYEVERSLRFNDDDTAYLSRNFGTGGNRKKWTFSAWIKRSNLGGTAGEMRIFGGSTNASHIYFASNDKLTWDVAAPGSSTSASLVTTQLFRDPSAWFHLVCAFDTDNSTADNRMRIYINGTEVTSFGTRTNPSSGYAANAINADAFADGDRSLHTIGYRTSVQGSAGMQFDGYMAEINFIDGQQYDPSYFGETNPITGQWNPKKYVGGYGTTGFYLPLSDNSGTSATTLGKDSSGNGNNFTPNNFSVSTGIGNDSVTDTPTNNFCTLNSLDMSGNALEQANLQGGTAGTSGWRHTRSTFALPSTGKWYWEYKIPDISTDGSNGHMMGIAYSNLGFTQDVNSDSTGLYGRQVTGKYNNSSSSPVTNSHFTTPNNNDIFQFAYDADSQKLFTGVNNTWELSANPSTGSNPNWTSVTSGGFPMVGSYGSSRYVTVNFGQQGFVYTPPTGYKALNSANLPNPTIKLPDKHFDTLTYTGNDSSDRDITGVGFQPDWLWIKNRSQTDFHMIMDSVRGANKNLYSNDTDNEQTDNANGHVNSFLTDGFNVDAGGSGLVNENSEDYVAWNWNAGDTDGKTYTVTVVDDSGNKFRFDGYGTSAVTLDLAEGGTYVFNYPSGHPFRFSTTSDGWHGGGSEYTTGVTHNSSTQVTIVVAASAPTLYYYCSSHSGMGGQVNTNSTLGSSNFDGAIQSVVKTNTTAGFSITTYTGTGSSTTVGHGLGVKPDWIIIKCRSNGDNWMVYHKGVNSGVDPEDYYLELNATTSQVNSTIMLNDTAPTSSVVTIGSDNSVNGSSRTYVMYAFSEVSSYCKFGFYTGNGSSSDGTYVFFGFRPAFFMAKEVSSTSRWSIYDNKRDTDNPNEKYLRAQANNAETTSVNNDVDFLSNGVKMRGTGEPNASGITYIYIAFEESPFKNARAR